MTLPEPRELGHRVVGHLALACGRDPEELGDELRAAGDDLPVDPEVVLRALPGLADELGLVLDQDDREVLGALCYVPDVVALLLRRLAMRELEAASG